MIQLGIPKKLVRLTKMTLEKTKNMERITIRDFSSEKRCKRLSTNSCLI